MSSQESDEKHITIKGINLANPQKVVCKGEDGKVFYLHWTIEGNSSVEKFQVLNLPASCHPRKTQGWVTQFHATNTIDGSSSTGYQINVKMKQTPAVKRSSDTDPPTIENEEEP